jgi:hypothetical protein
MRTFAGVTTVSFTFPFQVQAASKAEAKLLAMGNALNGMLVLSRDPEETFAKLLSIKGQLATHMYNDFTMASLSTKFIK